MRIPLLTLLLLFLNSLTGGEVRLNGKVSGAEGKVLRVYRYDDLVSLREVRIGTANITDAGEFTLTFPLDQIGLIQLFIDYHRAEVLVAPDHTYVLQIEGFNLPDYREEVNPWLNPPYLDILPTYDPLNRITHSYDSLNAISDAFILDHPEMLRSGRLPAEPDTIIRLWQDQLNCAGTFMETAITYRLAQMSIGINRKQRLQTFERYIDNKPLWQDHPDYMGFFKQYFDKYILTSRQIPFHEVARVINNLPDYLALNDLLGRDSLLRNAMLRELVLLVNMRDLFYHPELRSAGVLAILQQMASDTRLPAHKRIAQNLIHELQHLAGGSKAPPFSLRTQRNETVSVENFSGKYVYIQFFTSWCTQCIADMQLMEKLQKEFGDHIHLLSISADLEPARYATFLKRYPFPWQFAHFEGDFDLIKSYKVKAYPLYIILDKEGQILAAPARSPSEEVAVYFSRLLNPLRKP